MRKALFEIVRWTRHWLRGRLPQAICVLALIVLFFPRPAQSQFSPCCTILAAGLATIIGLQTFLIIGGVTRVIPLTGISLPFVSYGGSSLVANFALLAILLRISDDTVRAEPPAGTA